MERSRSLSPMRRKWVGQKAGPRVQVGVKPLRVFPFSSSLTLLDRAAFRAPWELPFRVQNARHYQIPWRPGLGAVKGGPAPPLRAGYQTVPNPPRGQPYFPLPLWLFPLLQGGDRALGVWVRFLGLPGPLRARLLWASSCLSLKKNSQARLGTWGGREAEWGTWVHAHT